MCAQKKRTILFLRQYFVCLCTPWEGLEVLFNTYEIITLNLHSLKWKHTYYSRFGDFRFDFFKMVLWLLFYQHLICDMFSSHVGYTYIIHLCPVLFRHSSFLQLCDITALKVFTNFSYLHSSIHHFHRWIAKICSKKRVNLSRSLFTTHTHIHSERALSEMAILTEYLNFFSQLHLFPFHFERF